MASFMLIVFEFDINQNCEKNDCYTFDAIFDAPCIQNTAKFDAAAGIPVNLVLQMRSDHVAAAELRKIPFSFKRTAGTSSTTAFRRDNLGIFELNHASI